MNKFLLVIYIFIFLFLSSGVSADHKPGHAKLEWGVGLVALSAPDYRGSDHSQDIFIPFPYLKYRGERLRIDDGIEGRFFNTPDLLLSISGNGSLPSGNDNPEREGMDELDATLEFGPSLEYRMFHNETTSLWLELPLRFAFAINEDFKSIGKVFHPRLAWRKPALTKQDWKLRLAGGPLYADDENHGYYYNVQPHEATPDRPIFDATDGYSGFRMDFTYSKRIDKIWLGGFIRYDDLSDSEFEDSPLVTTSSNWTAGFGLAWVISEK